MRGRERKQGMLAELPRRPQGTRSEGRKAVHFGQAPGLPGISLGSVPGCEVATLHGAFFQEPVSATHYDLHYQTHTDDLTHAL